MAEADFKVKISVDASSAVSGAQQTSAELGKIGEAGKKAWQDNAEGADKAAGSTKNISDALKGLGREFPILGQVGRLALNPLALAVAGIAYAFGLAKQKLEEWNAALDAMAARNAQKDFLPGIEAKVAALQDAAASGAAFQESLRGMGEAEDAFAKKVGLAIDKLREFVTAQAEVRSAEEARDLARVNLQEKEGKLTGAQAIVARAGIREQYRSRREQDQTAAENAELALKESELAHARAQAPALEQEAEKKRAEAAKLRAAQAQARADLPEAQKALEEAEAAKTTALEKADEARAKAARMQGLGPGFGGQLATGLAEGEAAAAAQRAMEDYDRARRRVDQNKQALEEIPVLGAGVFSEEKLAESRATKNAARILDLEDQTGRLRGTLPIRQAGRAEAGRLAGETTRMETQRALQDQLNRGRQDEARLQSGVTRSVESGSAVTEAMLEALKKVVNQNQEVQREIQRLGSQVSSLNATRKANPPTP